MTPHASTPFLLLAIAASAAAQQPAKPAPELPPVLPDVKTAPVIVETTPAAVRDESSAVRPAPRIKLEAASATSKASPIDFSRLHFDDSAADGALWVRARGYKASFDAEGATFIPFLGSQAPRNFPVRVELDAATVGSARLALEHDGVTRSGDTVAIDRGALREVWHLGLDSAEQTFEIASRPAAQGAIELRLALETELAIRPDGEGGLALDGEHGGVRIGRATAVDAGGRRLDLATRIEGASLAIEVPADFAATARYPLVVDPLYSANALDTLTNECALPDIAGSGASGYFAAVYEYAYSATDADLYTADVYFGFPVAGSGTWVDSTTTLWQIPRIAYNALHDTYLVVAQRRATTGAAAEIWCRARQAGTSTQYAQTLIQNNSLGSCFYADVGGDPALVGPTYFLAAWTRNFGPTDWDVHARLIDWNGAPLGGPIFLDNTSAFDWRPSVSKTDGRPPYATQNWNIVWMRNTTSSNLDIRGAQVRWDGALTNAAFTIDASGSNDTYPSASSPLDGAGARPWMVAFSRAFSDTDIVTHVLEGATVVGGSNLSADENVALFENQIQPDVDTNGQRFIVAYSESYQGSTSDRDAYVTTVAWTDVGLRLDDTHVNIDYSSRDTVGVQVSGCITESNYGFNYHGLAWSQYGLSPGDVFSGCYYEPGTYEGFCYGDGSSGSCPCGNTGAGGRGCANSETTGAGLFPNGLPNIAADTFSLQAYALPSTTTALFFQGTAQMSATAFGDGLRCAGGSILRLATKVASSGNVIYPEAGDAPISVRGLLPAVGGQRVYQVWYRNAASFCTASTFNTTGAIRVRWLR